MTSPIKLFWFNKKPNFGDALSPSIVSYVAKREVVWADPQEATLFSTGSLYDFIQARALKGEKLAHVWGSGTLGPMKNPFWGGIKIHAQRGPLTRMTTLARSSVYCDPALLYPLVFGRSSIQSEMAVFIPHLNHFAKARRYFEENPEPGLRLVTPRTEDHRSVVDAIAQARVVFSSSLHGLVLADAYNVPNVWVDPTGIHRWPKWKFLDYFLSVGRPLRNPISIESIVPEMNKARVFDDRLTRRIDKRRQKLIKSFPLDI